ncbi:Sugar transferase involved in LPS biosynthesis (colanic, teichoic acid) [Blastococcus aggregatus]|uniref:Sugar transferase involved in LPS biosynthesis (Colanic, teichoic acid) n=1 Tax=Blastococcus aggregatus TaxID=38502 RepID=A0A285V1G5_9ACTN|nr:sugar transferase [Blastococcus aggregatus]SOC47757.1 Sugar transferase involved in LPS biosynthesis (colanic, teichoic acid) [Blastococcus aggregatus]
MIAWPGLYPPVKRLLDIAASGTALVITAPVMGVVALTVRSRLGSPVLFQQLRPGRDGELFELRKFRTMRAGAGTDAERMTDLGRFLRSTSLDELPSLWNVLRGDMSLVGPRPLLPAYMDRYTASQARRHHVRPGLTGLAQVRGRNALSWEEKFASDVEYVETMSLATDVKVLFATILAVVSRRGISANDSETMPEFLGTADSVAATSPERRS